MLYQGWAKYLRETKGFRPDKKTQRKLLSEEQKGIWSMLARGRNAWMKDGRGRLEFAAKYSMGDSIERVSFF